MTTPAHTPVQGESIFQNELESLARTDPRMSAARALRASDACLMQSVACLRRPAEPAGKLLSSQPASRHTDSVFFGNRIKMLAKWMH